jgi:thymidylate synthase (FAD)
MERNAALAALTCRGNADKEHVASEILGRIIKAGHESVLEHITLTYSVKGISRALLQELARHRHISLSVESTRHTLRKNIENPEWVKQAAEGIEHPVFRASALATRDLLLGILKSDNGVPNDELKYLVPELWPTNLVLTSNVRELRHILRLRTAPAALKEFRNLAYALYEAVPEQFKYLFKDCIHEEASHE